MAAHDRTPAREPERLRPGTGTRLDSPFGFVFERALGLFRLVLFLVIFVVIVVVVLIIVVCAGPFRFFFVDFGDLKDWTISKELTRTNDQASLERNPRSSPKP